jgi:hypothetical protein
MGSELAGVVLDWLNVAASSATFVALVIGILQLRNVRRSVELQTNLAVMQAERSIWGMALSHPDVAPTIMKERWGEPASERLFAAMLLDHYEALYFQHKRGAIPTANWRGIERAMIEHIASPSVRTVWDGHKDLYWPEFVTLVERRLNRRPKGA